MLTHWWQRLMKPWGAWWQRRAYATQSLPRYVWRALRNFAKSGANQASALAYYAVFSIFPMVLLLAIVLSNLAGPAIAQEQIANALALFLPKDTVSNIQVTLGSALNQSAEFGFIALIGLLWSATGLFSNLTGALDSIFAVPSQRSIWRMRLLALLMGFSLVLLILASFLTTGILRLFLALSFDLNIWITISLVFVPLGFNLVIFALVFRYIPARRVLWDAIWPSAMLGALGWELSKIAFEWYLSNFATYSIIYGSIATGIVLLFWAYLIASILLFSAELCARLNEWHLEVEAHEQGAPQLVSLPNPEAPRLSP